MTEKNAIRLSLNLIPKDQNIEIEGIHFSGICYINVTIDNVDLLQLESLEPSFVYFAELKKSSMQSGRYLIFTCVCGIADDGGWDYIEVHHKGDTVTWSFQRDEVTFLYMFDREQYQNEITKLETEINDRAENLVLEPKQVVYPHQ